MPRPAMPEPDFGEDVFKEPQPATAGLLNRSSAPPPPPPSAPAAPPTAPASTAEKPNADPEVSAEPKPAPVPGVAAEPPAAVPVTPVAESVATEPDPVDSLPTKVDRERAAEAIEAVFAIIKSDPEMTAGAVQRLASATDYDPYYLNALQERIYESVPPVGKFPEPLDVAPNLHQRAKTEVARQRRRGDGANLTTVVLAAIGEAHTNGKIPGLVASFRGGERRKVPLFGNLVVGTVPRGATVKLQFAPDARSRMMLDVLTSWFRVPRANLVRLVLEDRYRREPRKPAPQTDSAEEDAAFTAEAVG